MVYYMYFITFKPATFILKMKENTYVYIFIFRHVFVRSIFIPAFRIPPDFDDTFVNMGLGGLLMQFSNAFSEGLSTWRKHNANLHNVFENLKKYSYR